MMQNIRRTVSEYGFAKDDIRCRDCGGRPQMVIVTGEDDGKFAAFQVECSECFLATHLFTFYKFDALGDLERVNPYAREQAEVAWADLNEDEP